MPFAQAHLQGLREVAQAGDAQIDRRLPHFRQAVASLGIGDRPLPRVAHDQRRTADGLARAGVGHAALDAASRRGLCLRAPQGKKRAGRSGRKAAGNPYSDLQGHLFRRLHGFQRHKSRAHRTAAQSRIMG